MANTKLTIKDKDSGVVYNLEFNRTTVKRLEAEGFVPSELVNKAMTYLPMLFRGAFYANHKRLDPTVIDDIYKQLPDKDGLIEVLATMYQEPLKELFADPEDDAGNVTWEAAKR